MSGQPIRFYHTGREICVWAKTSVIRLGAFGGIITLTMLQALPFVKTYKTSFVNVGIIR